MNSKQSDSAQFSIGTLAERTGVNSVTLRAWERRYGLLKPSRSAKGHRFYSEQDVEKVVAILGWIKRGVSVGKVKALLETAQAEQPSADTHSHWQVHAVALLNGLQTLQWHKLDQLYTQLSQQYPLQLLAQHWLYPVCLQLQEAGQQADLQLLTQRLRLWVAGSAFSVSRNAAEIRYRTLLIHDQAAIEWQVLLASLWLQQSGAVCVIQLQPGLNGLALLEKLQVQRLVYYHEGREAVRPELLSGALPAECLLAGPGLMLSAADIDADKYAVQPDLLQALFQIPVT